MLDYYGVLEQGRILSQPFAIPGKVRAAADRLAADGSPEAAEVLARAFLHAGFLRRPIIATALLGLGKSRAIEQAWACWADARCDALAEVLAQRPLRLPCDVRLFVLSRLKSRLLQDLERLQTRDVTDALLEACTDRDSAIAGAARHVLLATADHPVVAARIATAPRVIPQAFDAMRSPPARDALCATWRETRNPSLARVLEQMQAVATAPPTLRVSTELRFGPQPAQVAPADLAALLAATADPDPLIAERALAAIGQADAEALAEAVLSADCPPRARQAVAARARAPRDPARRALFFLLTDQVDAALDLDCDLSWLSAAYRQGEPAIRRRVAAAIRRAGGPLCRILRRREGDDFEHLSMSDLDWDTLVQGLGDRTDELWSLLVDAPPSWALRIRDRLHHLRFTPPEDGMALWQRLGALDAATADWSLLDSGEKPRRDGEATAPLPWVVVATSGDGTAEVWLPRREYRHFPSDRRVPIEAARNFDLVALSHDGRQVALGRNDAWRVYEVDLDRSMDVFRLRADDCALPGVRALAFSPDGALLAVSTRHTTEVVDLSRPRRRLATVRVAATALAWDEDGRRLAIAGASIVMLSRAGDTMQVQRRFAASPLSAISFEGNDLVGLDRHGGRVRWTLGTRPIGAFTLAEQLEAERRDRQNPAWACVAALMEYRRRYDIEIEEDIFAVSPTDIEIC